MQIFNQKTLNYSPVSQTHFLLHFKHIPYEEKIPETFQATTPLPNLLIPPKVFI